MNGSGPDRDRLAMADLLRTQFPEAAERDSAISPIVGGRRAALEALARIRPAQYGRTRNFLDGAVTRLSPYLTHGVLSLAEVRDAALAAVTNHDHAEKLIRELGWRDYYRRVYRLIGNEIWNDLEGYKTGHAPASYAQELPADLVEARTGLACMDAFVKELYTTGYLHNHARMWLAAYVVHHRRVQWQAGARWFLLHLLDGDVASNNLSWQWVASTFSHKPYFFNRENLERYTGSIYCESCPIRGECDFEGNYAQLEERLFVRDAAPEPAPGQPLKAEADAAFALANISSEQRSKSVVWVHPENLDPGGPGLAAYPESPALFVWDQDWLANPAVGIKRIMFIAECLAELPGRVEVRYGRSAEVVAGFAAERKAERVVTADAVSPVLQSVIESLEREWPLQVEIAPTTPFVVIERPVDLGRYSRYWRIAERRL